MTGSFRSQNPSFECAYSLCDGCASRRAGSFCLTQYGSSFMVLLISRSCLDRHVSALMSERGVTEPNIGTRSCWFLSFNPKR